MHLHSIALSYGVVQFQGPSSGLALVAPGVAFCIYDTSVRIRKGSQLCTCSQCWLQLGTHYNWAAPGVKVAPVCQNFVPDPCCIPETAQTCKYVSLPDLALLLSLLQSGSIVMEVLLALFGYWTGLVLALRSKEIFLLRSEYFHPSVTFPGCFELRWPPELIGQGVKAGPVRVIHKFQIPMMQLFCKFPRNPFVFLARGDQLNTFLSSCLV